MNRYKYILFIAIAFFHSGCSNGTDETSNRKNPFSDYFKSSKIETQTNNDSFIVHVKDSRLISEKIEKMGTRWVNSEAYASVSSIIALDYLDSLGIRNISVVSTNIEYNNEKESYSFTIQDLVSVKAKIETVNKFLQFLASKKISEVQPLIADKILKEMTQASLEKFFNDAFLNEKINKTEFIAFKIKDGITSVFFNLYYESGIQSYAFNFKNEENKIGGISVM